MSHLAKVLAGAGVPARAGRRRRRQLRAVATLPVLRGAQRRQPDGLVERQAAGVEAQQVLQVGAPLGWRGRRLPRVERHRQHLCNKGVY